MLKSLHAVINLGFHLLWRLLRRLCFKRSAGLNDFLSFYREDRIPPVSRGEKELIRLTSRCITCGLCDTRCPSLTSFDQSQFLGPSFWPHLSRSVPNFTAVSLPLQGCEECGACEEVCPTKVPLLSLLEYIKEKSRACLTK